MKEQTKTLIATKFSFLRYIVLSILRRFAVDIKMKNPYSKKPFHLNVYNHKGYWFYGKARESDTTNSLKRLVKNGDAVIEVGGHIGFLSHLYSQLVGVDGSVHVFEPGDNNLPYTRLNLDCLKNVTLHEKGCSDNSGIVEFHLDSLSGQNNSILKDYGNVDTTAASHYVGAYRKKVTIKVMTLDKFIENLGAQPKHIKIDVEGAELLVIKGMSKFLGIVPTLMIEVTRDEQEVFSIMKTAGYLAYDDNLLQIQDGHIVKGNVFFILDGVIF
jgi:FkbM family methyltransferase